MPITLNKKKLSKVIHLMNRIDGAIKKTSNSKVKSELIYSRNKLFSNFKHTLLSEKNTVHLLGEKKMVIWRTLSMQESRVDYQLLSEKMDEYEGDLEDELSSTINEDIARNIPRIKNLLLDKNVAGLSALSMVSSAKVASILNKYAKKSYETGKILASQEMKISNPVTPTLKTQLINLDTQMMGEMFSFRVNNAAKQKIKEALEKGIDLQASLGKVTVSVRTEADRMVANISSSIVIDHINKGRRLSFDSNVTNIQGYQRSEVLDGRTCNVCMSLDERVIEADDPMRLLDLVHDNCRGIWVAVLKNEEFPDAPMGIPATIANAFDTTGGVPTQNSFKQISKPINQKNVDVRKEIKRRSKAPDAHTKKYGY